MKTKPNQEHTILWADDDPDDLHIVHEVLETIEHDHRIVEVPDGCAAINHLTDLSDDGHYPCLIILDNNMPVMSGLDALVLIRKERKFDAIPVVLFSTTAGKHDQDFCARYGAKIYTKPNTFEEYRTVVSELLNYCNRERT